MVSLGQRRALVAAVDTSALLAIASSRDQYHARAVETAKRFHGAGGRWLGSALVIGELHAHLLHHISAVMARRVVSALLNDPAYEWHDVTIDLERTAVHQWLERFADQDFSLTDAVTFEFMSPERVRNAFAFDNDFVVAGFELL
jgi:predicted nucleic acid-binding protein